jgi:hypothetical protein
MVALFVQVIDALRVNRGKLPAGLALGLRPWFVRSESGLRVVEGVGGHGDSSKLNGDVANGAGRNAKDCHLREPVNQALQRR